ncbi:hypothetical protein [Actinoplanes sp. NPDC049316]|uniref:hypothetical protein n=1 Tax=Actinoplanes sp. NPDC049316 TaxID=3154727 RepID=UPI003444689A
MDESGLVAWMLEGDPAVRWKVTGDPRERDRIATEGWGARLLAEQDPDGRWGGGAYSPKWTSTTYTLLRLAWLGLPPGHPAALRGCERLWEWQSRWRTAETCVAAMLVTVTRAHGYAADRLPSLVELLLDRQQDDGGWNCAAGDDRGRHSSFHTTVMALEALHAYDGAAVAHGRGREFFLRHRLYRSHRTGEVAISGSTRLRAFPEWHFDVLRGLELFARCDHHDERLSDAVDVVRAHRRRDGTWPVVAPYPGKQWFEIEPRGPSRWNTARARAVLGWWDGQIMTTRGSGKPLKRDA